MLWGDTGTVSLAIRSSSDMYVVRTRGPNMKPRSRDS